MLAVVFGAFGVFADDCFQQWDASKNLIPDPEMTDISLYGGWGNKSIVNKTDNPDDKIYCGETAGKIWGTNGGSIDVTAKTALKANTAYRVRAQIYVVSSGQFQFGALDVGDLVTTTKTDEWELVDHIFLLASASNGLYFNNYGRGGDVGYIDNWELYEWSTQAYYLDQSLKEAQRVYTEEGIGAAELKVLMDAAESLLAELTLNNLTEKEAALLAATESLDEEVYTYKNNNPDAEGFLEIDDKDYIKSMNLSFEDGLTNWTNNGFQTQGNASFSLKAGTTYCEKWAGSPPVGEASVYQVAEIPNGVYKITVAAHAINQADLTEVCTGVYFFANDVSTEIHAANTYSVITKVLDGKVNFGVNITASNTANWVAFDNVKFAYREFTAREATEVLASLYDEVMIYIDGTVYANSVEDELVAVEEKIQAINDVAQPTLEEVNAVIAELATVFNDIKASATAYGNLKTSIDKATGLYDASKPAAEVLKAKLDIANEVYAALEADVASVDKTAEELNYAILRFQTATISVGSPQDVSDWFTNLNFETGSLTGWTNNGFQTQSNTGLASKEGTYYCEKWVGSGSLADADVHQTITAPNGTYTISFVGFATQGGVGSTGTYCYVNGTDFEFGEEDAYTFDVVVKEKSFTLGVKTVSTAANWAAFDNFTILYKGYDAEVIISDLQAKLDEAKALYLGKAMKSDVATDFNAVIAEVEAALASKAEEDLDAASASLNAILPLLKESTEAYASLLAVLDKANAIKQTGTNELNTLDLAIDAARAVYDGREADVAEIEEAIAKLEAAISAFNRLNPSEEFPYDATAEYLINASFETQVFTGESHTPEMGWEYLSESTFSWANNGNFTLHEGSRFLESWISVDNLNEGNTLPYLEMAQTLQNLPAGKYNLHVAAQSIIQNDPIVPGSGFFVYAGDRQTEVGLAEEIVFEGLEISDGTLTIGFKTDNPQANWISIDNFRLYYLKSTTGIETIGNGIPFAAYMNGNQLNVKFTMESESKVELAVYNAQGVLLAKQAGIYAVGNNVVSLNAHLVSGVYLVQLNCDGQKFVAKIVK